MVFSSCFGALLFLVNFFSVVGWIICQTCSLFVQALREMWLDIIVYFFRFLLHRFRWFLTLVIPRLWREWFIVFRRPNSLWRRFFYASPTRVIAFVIILRSKHTFLYRFIMYKDLFSSFRCSFTHHRSLLGLLNWRLIIFSCTFRGRATSFMGRTFGELGASTVWFVGSTSIFCNWVLVRALVRQRLGLRKFTFYFNFFEFEFRVQLFLTLIITLLINLFTILIIYKTAFIERLCRLSTLTNTFSMSFWSSRFIFQVLQFGAVDWLDFSTQQTVNLWYRLRFLLPHRVRTFASFVWDGFTRLLFDNLHWFLATLVYFELLKRELITYELF